METPQILRRIVSKVPQVTADNSIAPKRANSRFFTDCYPISAVFAPKLNQIPPRIGDIPVGPFEQKNIINHLISDVWAIVLVSPAPQMKKVPAAAAGTFGIIRL
jgi:hypothetical protein